MKTLVLIFHPNLEQSKVSKLMANKISKQSNIIVRDMYSIYPDGNIDVATEQSLLQQADRIVFQFPMYWYNAPALLRQWEDDVFTHGFAYGSQGGALTGKELVVAISTGAELEEYVRDAHVNYTVTDLLRPFQATSDFTGMTYKKPFMVGNAVMISEEELEKVAEEYASYITSYSLSTLGTYE